MLVRRVGGAKDVNVLCVAILELVIFPGLNPERLLEEGQVVEFGSRGKERLKEDVEMAEQVVDMEVLSTEDSRR